VRVPRIDRSVATHVPRRDAADPLAVTSTRPRPGLALIRVVGEVDVLTEPGLRAVLARSLADVAGEETPSVVCDLEGVTFLGATGVDVFVDAWQQALAEGVWLVLVARHRTVLRPFRLTAADRGLTPTRTHPILGRYAADPEVGR